MEIESRIVGSLVGLAVGDALGLPYENLSARRARRLYGPADRHHFLLHRGMVSDDTEHSALVVQALLASRSAEGFDAEVFGDELACRLRRWILTFPWGWGKATLLACWKLCLGWSRQTSGVFSAGNGPAMRAPILGLAVADWPQAVALNRISSQITHTDPKAEMASLAVVLAARLACQDSSITPALYWSAFDQMVASHASDEFITLMQQTIESVQNGQATGEFVQEQWGRQGVSGYCFHTVPAVIHAWLSNPDDFEQAIPAMIALGGDADSTAAILGGLIGARVGNQAIPARWKANIVGWPIDVPWIEQLGQQLARGLGQESSVRSINYSFGGALVRNAVFLLVVVVHVLRRLFPPY